MHPLHAIDAGLAEYPATALDLRSAIPRDELIYVFHPDDAAAEAVIEEARLSLALGRGTGASPLGRELPNAWSIFWHAGWLMLRGHLFGRNGRVDPTSPVLLVNRSTLVAIYGPKVPELGAIVLGNTLACEALDQARVG